MARTIEKMNEFVDGEYVAFSVLGRERGGTTVIASAATVTLTVTIAATREGAPLYEFTDADSQIALADAATGQWDVSLAPSDISSLVEGKMYFVDVWCTKSGGEIIHQKKATLTLMKSVELT